MSTSAAAAGSSGPGVPLVRERLDLFAIIVLTVLCAIWGTQQVVVKIAEQQGLPPALQAALRSALSAFFLVCWVAARGGWPALRKLFAIDRSLAPGLASAVIFSTEFLLLYFGLERTTASRAVLFLYASPFFVAIGVHFLVPAERLGLRQLLGLFCAFAGIAAAVFDGLRGAGSTLLGDAMVSGTALLWASLTVMAKASSAMRSVTPAKVLLYQLGGSAPVMLLFAAVAGELPAIGGATLVAWELLLFQSFVVAFVSYLIWYWLITRYPAGKVAAFSFLTPLFGLAAGGWILDEPVSAALMLALVLVAMGLYLVNGARAKSRLR